VSTPKVGDFVRITSKASKYCNLGPFEVVDIKRPPGATRDYYTLDVMGQKLSYPLANIEPVIAKVQPESARVKVVLSSKAPCPLCGWQGEIILNKILCSKKGCRNSRL
jgi:hypothetical protein